MTYQSENKLDEHCLRQHGKSLSMMRELQEKMNGSIITIKVE